MAEIWKPQPIEVYRSWIDAILSEASDRLNDWETKFIESVDERTTLMMQLSQGQAEKLEQIYAKYTS